MNPGAFPIWQLCSVTEFVLEDVKYYYWLARFGGNATGHVIRGCVGPFGGIAPPQRTDSVESVRAMNKIRAAMDHMSVEQLRELVDLTRPDGELRKRAAQKEAAAEQKSAAGETEKMWWMAVARNFDDELSWTCPSSPAPHGFMERFRAVVEKE